MKRFSLVPTQPPAGPLPGRTSRPEAGSPTRPDGGGAGQDGGGRRAVFLHGGPRAGVLPRAGGAGAARRHGGELRGEPAPLPPRCRGRPRSLRASEPGGRGVGCARHLRGAPWAWFWSGSEGTPKGRLVPAPPWAGTSAARSGRVPSPPPASRGVRCPLPGKRASGAAGSARPKHLPATVWFLFFP